MSQARPFLPAGSATIDDFQKLDIRVGRVVGRRAFPEARRPAYQLTIDFGAGRESSVRRRSCPARTRTPGPWSDAW